MPRKIYPIHPGEILKEEFLKPFKLSEYRLARDIGVPPRRINEIVHGNRAVTADTALRFSHYFGMSAQFWMNLQSRYELARGSDLLASRFQKEVKPFNGMTAALVLSR